jgi:hypothetical protein
MRFRLFRSRAFWFGVPGLVFLFWAWGHSSRWESKGSVSAGRWYCHLTQGQGYLQIDVSRSDSPGPVSHYRARMVKFSGERSTRAPGQENRLEWQYWPQWRHHEMKPLTRGSISIRRSGVSDVIILPHWFLLLIYLIPWGGVMFWRLRKRGALPPAG